MMGPDSANETNPAGAHPAGGATANEADQARAALRGREFRLLTGAWALSNIADSVLMLILAVWVKDLTGSDGAAGLVFAALGVPALISPLLGQVADRVSRRAMVVVSFGVGAGVVAVLFAVHSAAQLWLIYVVAVIYSSVGFATAAAQSGLLRDMLPDAALAPANGRLTAIDQAFRLIMPLVGAGVYTVVGVRPLIACAAVGFAGAAAIAARLRVNEAAGGGDLGGREPAPGATRGSFGAEMAAGFRHLHQTPPLGGLLVALVVAFAAAGMLNAVVFAVIDRGLGRPAQMVGVITTFQAGAAILAGLTAARLIRRWGSPRMVTVGLALVALGIAPMVGTSLIAVFAGMVFLGLGVTFSVIGFATLRQVKTPPGLQGRAAAATNTAINVPQFLVTIVAASLVAAVDYRIMLALTIAAVGAATVIAHRADQPRNP